MAVDSEQSKASKSDYSGAESLRDTPPGPPPIPNGGRKAWLQVVGAHFLWFNTW